MPSAGVRSHALATEELGPAPLARNAPLRQQARGEDTHPRPLIQAAVSVERGQVQSCFEYRPTSWHRTMLCRTSSRRKCQA